MVIIVNITNLSTIIQSNKVSGRRMEEEVL